jgi:hypothetical protein
MNDKREEIEIRRIIVVTSESKRLTPHALRPSRATRRLLRTLRLCENLVIVRRVSRKGAKAQSSQRYFPELSIYDAAL